MAETGQWSAVVREESMLPTVTDKASARHHLLLQKSMRGMAMHMLTMEQSRYYLGRRKNILTAGAVDTG